MKNKVIIVGCRDLKVITSYLLYRYLNDDYDVTCCITLNAGETKDSEQIEYFRNQCEVLFSCVNFEYVDFLSMTNKGNLDIEIGHYDEVWAQNGSITKLFKNVNHNIKTRIIFDGLANLNSQRYADTINDFDHCYFLPLHPPLVNYRHSKNITWFDDSFVKTTISEIRSKLKVEPKQIEDNSVIFLFTSIPFFDQGEYLNIQSKVIEEIIRKGINVYFKDRGENFYKCIFNRLPIDCRDKFLLFHDGWTQFEICETDRDFLGVISLSSTAMFTYERYFNIPGYTFPLKLESVYRKRNPWRNFICRSFYFVSMYKSDYRDLIKVDRNEEEYIINYASFFCDKARSKQPRKRTIIQRLSATRNRFNMAKLKRKLFDFLYAIELNFKPIDVLFVDSINMRNLDIYFLGYFHDESKLRYKYHVLSNDFLNKVKFLILSKLSKVVVTSINNRNFIDSNKNINHIQLWHAPGAFKKIVVKGSGYFVSSSKSIEHIIHRNFSVRKDVVSLGCVSTDEYFDVSKVEECKHDFFRRNQSLIGKKIYLYCPTYRKGLGGPELFTGLDWSSLSSSLQNDEVIIYKHHPSIINRLDRGECCTDVTSFDNIIDMSRESLFSLNCVADVVATDYSSIIFYAILMDLPVLSIASDVDTYQNQFLFDFRSDFPGDIVESSCITAVLDSFRNKRKRDNYYSFKDYHLSACDGNSKLRVKQFIESIVEERN
ncbi:CDP-glycerol glycerophosphotransferase family protein [Vibrio splendidus]|uniref:CDP-glycerol glycerophosphotransferase family protein n=1 Tax=Vibrio splendidus TaxID=29497 RepID=UPI000AFC5336|nr:CDP-glycerol glycerophosphotransferase family protein [Vibrio splendidus]